MPARASDQLLYNRFQAANLAFGDGTPVNNQYGEPGWLYQDMVNGLLYLHGAGNNRTAWSPVSTAGAGGSQKGDIALVNGQQSYALVFPVPFTGVPTFVIGSIAMVANNAESFVVTTDRSTLTVNGVTFWLSGVPGAASVGSFLNWKAEL